MIPARSFGSPGIATMRWKMLRAELGDDALAVRAAYGRHLAHPSEASRVDERHEPRAVPQRGARSPEAVAWHRESGAAPGYANRHDRERERRRREAPPWL